MAVAESKAGGRGVSENFPVGMKVLLVDDDSTCLTVVKQMLLNCQYTVKTCCRATEALSLLREDKSAFDLILSDVHMPDMDGFRLLEVVGLEMDLPVIMMSADTRINIVMKGIKHGACDYLVKPVRMPELQNIWQHVVRRKWHDNKEAEHSASMDESDHDPPADDSEFPSSANDGSDASSRSQRKKRDSKEEESNELDTTEPSSSKKPRVVWSVELHQQFVGAVNQLGIDKAVPKKVLELMNVPGLTRENVASHLQKFRLYLKRLSRVAQSNNSYGIPSNGRADQLPNHDFNALALPGHVPSQTLAALPDELLGRPSQSLAAIPVLIQPGVQDAKTVHGIPFSSQNISSSYQVWPSEDLNSVGAASRIGGINTSKNRNMMGTIFPQQQSQSFLSESHVRPSSLVSPRSRSTDKFQLQTGTVLLNQNSHLVSSQSSSNPQEVKTSSTISQNPLAGVSVLSNSLQAGSNHVVMNEGSVIMPSQSLNGTSARTSPGLLNQSSAVIPSLPLTGFQATKNRHLINQNSVVVPLQQSIIFPVESNLIQDSRMTNMNNNTSVVDYSFISSHLDNVNQPTSMGRVFDRNFVDSTLVNTFSAPGLASLPSYNDHWRVQSPDENKSHPGGSPTVVASFCNIPATSRLSGSSVKVLNQEQTQNLGYVGTVTSFPIRFAEDDIGFPTSSLSHIATTIDESHLLNQDHFGMNGALQSGHCASSLP